MVIDPEHGDRTIGYDGCLTSQNYECDKDGHLVSPCDIIVAY